MKLKRLRIFGFKTFADRTELDVNGSVIAVVGPNGCGKSNLVDAILWGLGEGSARQLRAQTGQDVIFNGSALRKGVGYTEVQLVFDNEDGVLPVNSPEVAVSRKLNRAGETEYSINRQPCRQRDIYELLADSGLGRAGYAIVGQREIDQALNASAEDRRGWIDEAAGVQRYRSRKTESLRRLASAQDHLERVTQIISELEEQREPLREEAEIAARYKTLQSSLREIEVGFLVNEANAAHDEETSMGERSDRSQALSASEARRAEELEKDIQENSQALVKLDREAEELQGRRQQRLMETERTLGEIRLAGQRLESLDERQNSLADDRAELESRVYEAVRDFDRAEAEEHKEREELAALQAAVGGVGKEAKQLAAALDNAERQLAEARKQEAARLKQEAERAHREERLRLTRRELSSLDSSLPDLQKAATEAEADLTFKKDTRAKTEVELQEIEKADRAIKADEEQDARASRTALGERASLEGRIRGIESTIDSNEGLTQGARSVMEAAKVGILRGSYVPVAVAVQVKKEFAVAIETALGAAANDLIVESDEAAKDAIRWLKENRSGRATFQPIPLMRPNRPSQDLDRVSRDGECVGLASELVTCEALHRPVIESLLGRVVVVKTLEAALRLAKTSGWSRLITLEGEVVHSSGAVTGGYQSKPTYGIVQRKADLAELNRELSKMAGLISGFDKRSAERHRRLVRSLDHRKEIEARRKTQNAEIGEAESYFRALAEELKATLKEREKLTQELAAPEPTRLIAPLDIAALEAAKDEALKALAAKSADAESSRQRLEEAEQRSSQAKIRTEAAGQRLKHAQAAAESRDKKAESIEPERQRLQEQISLHEARQKELAQELAGLEGDLEKRQVERARHLEKSKSITESLDESKKNIEALASAIHQAELGRTRAQARRSAALLRLMDEYEMLPDKVEAERGLHSPPADATAVVQRLRREMRGMGEVNLGAIEAFERLSSRVDELSAQREDVTGGIKEVEASIRELDRLTRDRFVITFDQVSAAFAEMFEKLFGGGEGRLILTKPDEVLNSGIEIEVTLPGKRKQYLNLLSGGERALCTCAFLFALLKVKPSPLVILDEIDAPLDGRNVERFAETLLEFTDRTQFIVITHNPVTIAAAPVWIGVSMEEPGVSKLLPVQAPSQEGLDRVLSPQSS
jgi:chromosome segregation protein